MKPVKPLTADQIGVIRRLWAEGRTQAEICAAAGITVDTLRVRLRDQLADLPARPRRVNSGRRGVEPTPEEIVAATAEIRAGWGEERFLPEQPANDFEIARL
jgi:hypothetical protein